MRCRGAELPSLRAGQPGSREAGRPLQHAMAFHQNILQQASTYVDDFLESFEAAPAELTRVLETVRSLDERQAAIMEEHDKLVAQVRATKNARGAGGALGQGRGGIARGAQGKHATNAPRGPLAWSKTGQNRRPLFEIAPSLPAAAAPPKAARGTDWPGGGEDSR